MRLPEVLCVHFKRFRFDTYLSTKISRHIAFPLTDLDLSQYRKDSDNPLSSTYDLTAVVTHYGGAGGEYYMCVSIKFCHTQLYVLCVWINTMMAMIVL